MINTLCGFEVQKDSPPLAAQRVWTVGCVQALATLLEANVVPVSCTVSGIAVLQVGLLYFETFRTFEQYVPIGDGPKPTAFSHFRFNDRLKK